MTTRVSRTVEIIERGREEGLHMGAQLYVSVRGEVAADEAFGESRPGVAMATDTIVRWMSAVKPILAVALAQQWEAGRLEWDDPVARHVPEFGGQGKESVTLRHLLTHTAGLKQQSYTEGFSTTGEVLERIYASGLQEGWVPGEKAAYDPGTGWFVLAEVLRRVSGLVYGDYAREHILAPLGMVHSTLGMNAQEHASLGERVAETFHVTERGLEPLPWQAADLEVPWPGGSGRGPVRELGRFYEMLQSRGEWNGRRYLTPQSVEALTARHRVRMMDATFAHVYDWGLGFMLDSRGSQNVKQLAYDFGAHASRRTFGHGGSQCAHGFCDPEHGLVVTWAFNGLPGEAQHRRRNHALNTAIYEDLGLVG